MERNEGGDYEAGGEATTRTRPKGPSERNGAVGHDAFDHAQCQVRPAARGGR
ncbi:hypothetical protein N8703_00060 [Verrucomicrobia bacterium]|nr:hypothetical protein [Verrucomicrobiota bacterium]